jgi:hypothetical protein
LRYNTRKQAKQKQQKAVKIKTKKACKNKKLCYNSSKQAKQKQFCKA